MKLYYNGRQINGRFDSFKAKVRRFVRAAVRLFLIGSVAAALLMIAFDYGLKYSATTVQAVTPETIDLTPAKIEGLKVDLVHRLSICESAGHSEEDGLIIFDTNNRASVGQLQWQIASVQQYEKSLYGKTVTRKEAVLIALDTARASELAKDVIFKTDGLANWLNCANKLGLRAEVDAINRLSK